MIGSLPVVDIDGDVVDPSHLVIGSALTVTPPSGMTDFQSRQAAVVAQISNSMNKGGEDTYLKPLPEIVGLDIYNMRRRIKRGYSKYCPNTTPPVLTDLQIFNIMQYRGEFDRDIFFENLFRTFLPELGGTSFYDGVDLDGDYKERKKALVGSFVDTFVHSFLPVLLAENISRSNKKVLSFRPFDEGGDREQLTWSFLEQTRILQFKGLDVFIYAIEKGFKNALSEHEFTDRAVFDGAMLERFKRRQEIKLSIIKFQKKYLGVTVPGAVSLTGDKLDRFEEVSEVYDKEAFAACLNEIDYFKGKDNNLFINYFSENILEIVASMYINPNQSRSVLEQIFYNMLTDFYPQMVRDLGGHSSFKNQCFDFADYFWRKREKWLPGANSKLIII